MDILHGHLEKLGGTPAFSLGWRTIVETAIPGDTDEHSPPPGLRKEPSFFCIFHLDVKQISLYINLHNMLLL
jgi:hypothetical protein